MPQLDNNPSTQQTEDQATNNRSAAVGAVITPQRLATPLDQLTRRTAGKRSYTLTKRKRGRYVRAQPMRGRPSDLAFDATLRSAAPHQRQREAERTRRNLAFVVRRYDLQRKVRVRRAANLLLFVVDASWSMATLQRIETAKGAVLSLLHDAYRRRDQVGLITFRGQQAEVVLSPTSSVELAQRVLREVPVGGKTPLSAALLAAHHVCTLARRRDPEVTPLMILLTDGNGNVSLTGRPAQEEAKHLASLLKRSNIRSVVIDFEHPATNVGAARKLAAALGGHCYSLPELRADVLVRTVLQEKQG